MPLTLYRYENSANPTSWPGIGMSSHTDIVYMYILIWSSFVQADIANQYTCMSYIYHRIKSKICAY